jgi:hypothetical protein
LALADQDFVSAGTGISINGHVQRPGIRIGAWEAAAWENFTPVTLGFTLNNGVNACRFSFNGKQLRLYLGFLFGSTSVGDNTDIEVSLPTGVADPNYLTNNMLKHHGVMGEWSLYDASANAYYYGQVKLGTPPTEHPLRFSLQSTSAGALPTSVLRTNNPVAFATGDVLCAYVELETI